MDHQEQEAQEQALALQSKVDALKVVDQASYDFAQEINKQAYQGKKEFHDWFDPIDDASKKQLDASKKQRQAVIAQGKKIDEPFDYIIKTTGSRAAAWMAEEERKAAKLRQEAEAAARKKAEDKQLEEAQLLADLGMDEAAEEALVAEPVIEKVRVPEPTKAEGTSVRTYYSAEVVDLKALVVAVATGLASHSCIEANMVYLNGIARLEVEAMNIPGVRAIKEIKQSRRL